MSPRNTTLDIAKGISILLMTITHMVVFRDHPTIKHINAEMLMVFKMPLFIFVSGWLFSPKGSFREFVTAKADGLLKPMAVILFVAFVIVFIWRLSHGEGVHGGGLPTTIATVRDTTMTLSLYFIPLWFPTTLFVALVVFRTLTWLWETRGRGSFFATMAIVLLLTIIWRSGVSFYILEFHSLLIFVVFLWAGWMVRRFGAMDTLSGLGPFLFFASLFGLTIALRYWLGVGLDINANHLGDFLPTMIASLSGIMIVINLSRWLSRVPLVSQVLVLCSRGSFYILAFSTLLGNELIHPLATRLLPCGVLTDSLSWSVTIALCLALWRLTFFTRRLKYLLLPLKSASPA